jgi:hypothetical protein
MVLILKGIIADVTVIISLFISAGKLKPRKYFIKRIDKVTFQMLFRYSY